jgi:3-deoxy-D-manno-octulosonic-acid transferase
MVPRHPQRFDEVAALAQAGCSAGASQRLGRGPPPTRLSAPTPGSATRWARCRCTTPGRRGLLGGSFAPLGGQNLIEAAACGCPLLMGPHTFNFEEAAQLAIEAGAAARMKDVGSAVRRAAALVQDPRRNDWVEQALVFAQSHRGANERMAQRIALLLTGLDQRP